MIKMLSGMLAVVAVLAMACSSAKSSVDKTATGVAAAATKTASESTTASVQVDGDGDGYDAFMIHYFPDNVTLHPGDIVKFKLKDSGEPHTVSTGGPIDALTKFIYDTCGSEGLRAAKCQGQPPPDIEAQFNDLNSKLPQLLPDGPGDANQTAANPCFLATGTLPDNTACPKTDQPAFDGTQAFYSSGWLSASNDYVVKLSPDLKPGAYRFICLLHGPEMTETVNIVDKATKADTADDVKARMNDQLKTFTDALSKPAADLKAFKGADDNGVKVDVQAEADADAVSAGVAEFGPDTISIPVGGSVTWKVNGFHTISFNAGEDAKSLRSVAADGTVHLNEKAATPAQTTPPEPPIAAGTDGGPPTGQPPPQMFDGGTWNGDGFLSTGGIGDEFFKLTFSKAGTYAYKCLIHDGMEGTVKVGS
ncbi:MAG: hypothetical protein M3P30_05155 [Chloroflexota bacterium]|nr:hypothetical protein [Chloroflexota bacterium]